MGRILSLAPKQLLGGGVPKTFVLCGHVFNLQGDSSFSIILLDTSEVALEDVPSLANEHFSQPAVVSQNLGPKDS